MGGEGDGLISGFACPPLVGHILGRGPSGKGNWAATAIREGPEKRAKRLKASYVISAASAGPDCAIHSPVIRARPRVIAALESCWGAPFEKKNRG